MDEIDSASKPMPLEVAERKFEHVDIPRVIQHIHDSDMEVMANCLVGLLGYTDESMRAALRLSIEFVIAGWKRYPAVALPVSDSYAPALESGVDLPSEYIQYSFHSCETLPRGTVTLSPFAVAKFPGDAFLEFQANAPFRAHVRERFGPDALATTDEMNSYTMRRRIVAEGLNAP